VSSSSFALDLMVQLGIEKPLLVEGAYIDLLEQYNHSNTPEARETTE